MQNAKIREIWDEKAEMHSAGKESRAEEPSSKLYHESWRGYIQPLLSEIDRGRILEAGCGTGRWAEWLALLGFDLVLSDISPNMLAKAREYAEQKGFAERVCFEELDICDLYPFPDNSFDMVISCGEPVTICSNPRQAISEFCRVVRPGGYVLCDAGNRYRKAYDNFRQSPSGQALAIIETGEYKTDSGMELHLLGPAELSGIFADQKMELITLAGITPMFSFPPDKQLKKAMEDEATYKAMAAIAKKYAERPEIVHLSSRLLAVARKPV